MNYINGNRLKRLNKKPRGFTRFKVTVIDAMRK